MLLSFSHHYPPKFSASFHPNPHFVRRRRFPAAPSPYAPMLLCSYASRSRSRSPPAVRSPGQAGDPILAARNRCTRPIAHSALRSPLSFPFFRSPFRSYCPIQRASCVVSCVVCRVSCMRVWLCVRACMYVCVCVCVEVHGLLLY